jgi:hypothetical protein
LDSNVPLMETVAIELFMAAQSCPLLPGLSRPRS